MRKNLVISALTVTSIMLGACSGSKAPTSPSSFPIMNADGGKIGVISITPLKAGGVDLVVTVKGLTPGSHAMHFHEFGRCDAPNFKSAGGHYNPEAVAHGNHAGDMMNVNVTSDGTGKFEVTNGKVNLKAGSLPALMDADGTALIIHAGEDDYTSQPSGAAGPRVACAVISG